VSLPVRARREVSDDLHKLPSGHLRREAIKLMASLKDRPLRGKPLGIRSDTGDLSDCRKLYFNHARHRIIYRLEPDDVNPERVDVICVGARKAKQVYKLAVERLNREEPEPET
jgi:hypothetical protein